jgi:hypothetical protein
MMYIHCVHKYNCTNVIILLVPLHKVRNPTDVLLVLGQMSTISKTNNSHKQYIYYYYYYYSTGFYNPLAGFSLLILEVSRSHTMTHHSR